MPAVLLRNLLLKRKPDRLRRCWSDRMHQPKPEQVLLATRPEAEEEPQASDCSPRPRQKTRSRPELQFAPLRCAPFLCPW